MAKDRTFTHCDVLRIYFSHLDPVEQAKVSIFFKFQTLNDVLDITEITLPQLERLNDLIGDLADWIEFFLEDVLRVKNKTLRFFIRRFTRKLKQWTIVNDVSQAVQRFFLDIFQGVFFGLNNAILTELLDCKDVTLTRVNEWRQLLNKL